MGTLNNPPCPSPCLPALVVEASPQSSVAKGLAGEARHIPGKSTGSSSFQGSSPLSFQPSFSTTGCFFAGFVGKEAPERRGKSSLKHDPNARRAPKETNLKRAPLKTRCSNPLKRQFRKFTGSRELGASSQRKPVS